MLLLPPLLATPTYQEVQISGWTIKIGSEEINDPSWDSVLGELNNQLYRISRVVPDGPLAKLRKITIWIHKNDEATKCMAYHPAPEWLKEHGSDPQMAHGVEIANAQNFVSWTYEQPWMLLHELSHAYHHQFLEGGFDNKVVKQVWDAEMASKKYDHVLHYDGKTVKHYAETNPMEFFAECTEAYFGRNDFYPFVNAELKTFDPEGFALMKEIWGTPQKRP